MNPSFPEIDITQTIPVEIAEILRRDCKALAAKAEPITDTGYRLNLADGSVLHLCSRDESGVVHAVTRNGKTLYSVPNLLAAELFADLVLDRMDLLTLAKIEAINALKELVASNEGMSSIEYCVSQKDLPSGGGTEERKVIKAGFRVGGFDAEIKLDSIQELRVMTGYPELKSDLRIGVSRLQKNQEYIRLLGDDGGVGIFYAFKASALSYAANLDSQD